MRAFCLEQGVAIHQGAGKFKADFPCALANEENDLTAMMRRLLADLFDDLQSSNCASPTYLATLRRSPPETTAHAD